MDWLQVPPPLRQRFHKSLNYAFCLQERRAKLWEARLCQAEVTALTMATTNGEAVLCTLAPTKLFACNGHKRQLPSKVLAVGVQSCAMDSLTHRAVSMSP